MKKVTEGVGIVSGDGECWCINPIDPEPEIVNWGKDLPKYNEWDHRRVYPQNFFPDEVRRDGTLHGMLIKYKVTVEIEELIE